LDVDLDAHEHEHEHEDGTVHSHSHEEGHHDDEHEHEHEHDDGTVHSHSHSHDEEHSHSHEEESIIPVDLFNNKQQKHDENGVEIHDGDFASLVIPNLGKMTKKALDEWAADNGIILDRRKTKAHMLKELKKRLNA